MGEFVGSIDYFVDPSRTFIDENDHKAIVCHGTGGSSDQTVEQLGDFFRTTPSMVSVHYGIGRDGRIAQYVQESAGAGGNGILDPGHDPFWDQYADNPNKHSLSFETINDSTNSLPLTDPQKQTTFKLIAYWVKKYNIPLSNIKGHFTLEPVERARCPGPNFPWNELWAYLKGEQQPMQPTPTQLKEAQDCWNSFFKSVGQVPPPTGTGIYQAWVSDWINQGKQYGPPITHEYNSNDWSDNSIVVQEFAHARCEWVDGAPNWYSINGKI
jgi:hypothetical protein